MTKEELREECERLFLCKTLEDSYDLIDIYLEFLFLAIKDHHQDKVYSTANAEAKIVLQMIFTKALHLKRAVEGISYTSKGGAELNEIIDPTIVASLIRNIFETVGMFNLIYINTKTEDEKKILYNLWVIAGLKYRQRFDQFAKAEESKKKVQEEKERIKNATKEIEETELYKNLSEKNQGKIHTRIKQKDYRIEFKNKDVVFLHWQELTDVLGCQNDFLDQIYTYFSLYAHPSNVSVFQFAEMFRRNEEDFKELTNFNLKNFFVLLSVFIADYIKLFPKVLETYNKLDLRDQIVIDFQNTIIRGRDYSINDSWKQI